MVEKSKFCGACHREISWTELTIKESSFQQSSVEITLPYFGSLSPCFGKADQCRLLEVILDHESSTSLKRWVTTTCLKLVSSPLSKTGATISSPRPKRRSR